MKVLTAAGMREVDQRTIGLGISGPILMENAGHRVVEFLAKRFSPVSQHRVVVLCGKGNNGGDGYVIARQLWTRFHPASLHVMAVFGEDVSEARRMLLATGCPVLTAISPEMRNATLVIDAVLGTGIEGPARGPALETIREINSGFPLARVIAVDVPSGMSTDGGSSDGEVARADATITFTAPKLCHVLSPNCDLLGEFQVAQIGSPAWLMENAVVHLSNPSYFRHLFVPRKADSNKGIYGHVLVAGGVEGKTGAAEMTAIAALRAGAGLVTVASDAERHDHPELMSIGRPQDLSQLAEQSKRMNVVAIGPGLGTGERDSKLVREAVTGAPQAMVLDADALNILAGFDWRSAHVRVLTPHPGEMSRLAGKSVEEVQADRIGTAREFASSHNCILVLKGHRTVVALPDGRIWINSTGSPAMATGGTGDILTGLIAGTLARWRGDAIDAVLAAVWLHGRAGELGAARLTEDCLIATDLLTFLPEAIRECHSFSNEI
ncbi:MAG: NAD(P)H-hydrate dehydratase [Bryobacteraceae bacterium]|nr:NAD(P)H-hydrate dehydratase [Bryobacteraceae bacterium]